MPHAIEARIAALGARLRWLALASAACRFVAVALASLAVLGLFDYALRPEDHVVRLTLSLVALAAICWAAFRFLLPELDARFQNVSLAQRVEQAHPELEGQLSSAVAFLSQSEDDPLAGSASLRRAVIAETTTKLDRIDFDRVVDARPAKRAAIAALLVAAVAVALVAVNPAIARVSMLRLLNPFGTQEWPQWNRLVVEQPITRMARGQDFEVAVVDRDGRPLPRRAWMHYREAGSVQVVSEEMEIVDGKLIARRESVTAPFEYRATGGDDESMPWIAVEVVPPPALVELKATIIPPEYTGWEAEQTDGFLEALEGSEVRFEGRANRPLRSAALRLESDEGIEAEVAPDGLRFSLPGLEAERFRISKSGSYWFKLVDREGLPGGRDTMYEIRARADQPPTVTVEFPSTDQVVTPAAVLPLRIVARDDLAIARIEWNFTIQNPAERDARGGRHTIALYEGLARVASPIPRSQAFAGASDQRTIEQEWSLAEIGAQAGEVIEIFAAAADYRPQTTTTATRRLSVVTPAEFLSRVAQLQSSLLGDLARLAQTQRDARAKVRNVQIQLDETGGLVQQELDDLRAAELAQGQVNRGLTDTEGTIAQRAAGILLDLQNNRLDRPELTEPLVMLRETLVRLGIEAAPAITADLTSASKIAQSSVADVAGEDIEAVRRSLAAAGEQQDAVSAELDRLLEQLAEWDRYHRLYAAVDQLRLDQSKLRGETSSVGASTVGLTAAELSVQQKANIKKLVAQQLSLAGRFDDVLRRLRETAPAEDEGGFSQTTLDDAFTFASERALGLRMRRSADEIDRNTMGQALESQSAIVDDLAELLDVLANRRSRELARLVKKLRDAERQVGQLRAEQATLREALEEAQKLADEGQRRRQLERLTRRQQELKAEAERLGRELQRLEARRAQESIAQGAEKMGAAGESGQQGDALGAADHAQDAEKDLEEAQRQLAEARRQAEIDLANELVARMEAAVRSLVDREQKLQERTAAFDADRTEAPLDRLQRIAVQNLARTQRLLADETAELAKKSEGSIVFKAVLDRVAGSMHDAAELLAQTQTDEPAQRAQQDAIDRLTQLMSALEQAAPDENNEQQQQQGGEGGEQGNEGDPPPRSDTLAQLKLLKIMQEELNVRTERLEALLQPGVELTAEQRAEAARLREEQGKLADLLLNLSQPTPEPEFGDTLEEADVLLD